MKKTLSVVALAALIAGCGVSRTYNGLPVTVCGTRADVPVRVTDDRCTRNDADVQWYTAQNPPALDSTDRTDIGEEVDDDYLEYDDIDRPHVAPRVNPRPVTPAPRTSAPRVSAAPQAPRATAAPQAPRRQSTAPRRSTTRTR